MLIVLTPILLAHFSTFLYLFSTMSSSKVSINFKDHKPKILCLFSSDLTKYSKLSFRLEASTNLSIKEILKKGVSQGNVTIQL